MKISRFRGRNLKTAKLKCRVKKLHKCTKNFRFYDVKARIHWQSFLAKDFFKDFKETKYFFKVCNFFTKNNLIFHYFMQEMTDFKETFRVFKIFKNLRYTTKVFFKQDLKEKYKVFRKKLYQCIRALIKNNMTRFLSIQSQKVLFF